MHMPEEHSDEILFEQLRKDNQGAFRMLYNRYWDKLLQVAYAKLKIQEEAEEVIQEVFLSVWANRHKTTLKYSFRTYISAALKYSIYSKIASRLKYQNVEIGADMENRLMDHSTEQYLAFSEAIIQIETLVAQLPAKCQMVFRLSRDQGLTTREISTELDISEKTVEGHITKAVKYIKGNLNGFTSFLYFF